MPGWYGQDCCLNVVLPADAHPVLILEDEIDPFTGEEAGGYPAPRIYWSNGTITEGYLDDMGQPPLHPPLPS